MTSFLSNTNILHPFNEEPIDTDITLHFQPSEWNKLSLLGEKFIQLCVEHNVEEAQWLYSVKHESLKKQNLFTDAFFQKVCTTTDATDNKKCILTVKWLFEIWPEKAFQHANAVFIQACVCGNLELIQWIHAQQQQIVQEFNDEQKRILDKREKVNKEMVEHYKIEKSIKLNITKADVQYDCHIDLSNIESNLESNIESNDKSNLELNIDSNIESYIESKMESNDEFIYNGSNPFNIPKLKQEEYNWKQQIFYQSSFHLKYNEGFFQLCANGHLCAAQWLYQEPCINVQTDYRGQVINRTDLYKILDLGIRKPIDIKHTELRKPIDIQNIQNNIQNEYDAFEAAYCNGHLEVAKWLVQIQQPQYLEQPQQTQYLEQQQEQQEQQDKQHDEQEDEQEDEQHDEHQEYEQQDEPQPNTLQQDNMQQPNYSTKFLFDCFTGVCVGSLIGHLIGYSLSQLHKYINSKN